MGIHEVDIDVMDQQSLARVQTVQVRICECRNGVCLAKEKSVTFGPMGWLALLLPLLLLLLLCKSRRLASMLTEQCCLYEEKRAYSMCKKVKEKESEEV